MKLNLNTIIIFAQDVAKLKPFYVDVLGLEVLEEFPSTWLLLKAGACQIGLHQIGDAYLDKNAPPFQFDNNTKIVFETDTDIYELRQQLLHQNVAMREVKHFEQSDWLFCDGEDPEGNVFQLKQHKV
ncbi:VOC family protein [Pedobacter sp. ASV12]|uniref:VOC family protein n=1 Tax=Pedobacter sp. ASV12 TaxID=2795120 RepID=UPI0018ED3642|nr:VOC family protein [Pedobacter sp. ASV12]